jgi:hypothetical protein
MHSRYLATANHFSGVMAGLVPAIYALLTKLPQERPDARDKRGHDGEGGDSISPEHPLTPLRLLSD